VTGRVTISDLVIGYDVGTLGTGIFHLSKPYSIVSRGSLVVKMEGRKRRREKGKEKKRGREGKFLF
jgi:hypothetical protein